MSDWAQMFIAYVFFSHYVIVAALLLATLKELDTVLEKAVATLVLLLAPYLIIVGLLIRERNGM